MKLKLPQASSCCPECGSSNVYGVFSIPVGPKNSLYPIEDNESYNKCKDCRFEARFGDFDVLNKIKVRNAKIESLINDRI